MPILDLQRRVRELGRIRTGVRVPTSSGRTRPEKLSTFRFTSQHREYIDAIASLYGGDVRPWTPDGGIAQWEVITTATSIPVVVLDDSHMTQWMESWSAAGCQRRCDGKTETLSGQPCLCRAAGEEPGRDPSPCRPTTRLSVMLTELAAVGMWRLESHGWNAAHEVPGMAMLMAALFSRVGPNLPARLVLEERRSVGVNARTGKPETRHYLVPGLVPELTPAQLVEATTLDETGALTAPPAAQQVTSGQERPALAAGPAPAPAAPAVTASPDEVISEVLPLIAAAATEEDLRVLGVTLEERYGTLPALVREAGQARLADLQADAAAAAGQTAATSGGDAPGDDGWAR